VGRTKLRKLSGTHVRGRERTAKFKPVDERELAMQEENVRLARTEALVKLANFSEEDKVHVAWHESAHAVIAEVLSTGMLDATTVPEADEDLLKVGVLEVGLGGHIIRNPDTLPIHARGRYLHTVAALSAGGLATQKALGYAWGTEGDVELIREITLHAMHLSLDEAGAFAAEAEALCTSVMGEPKVWKAIEEVKDALLTENTIGGSLVRAIVKKQDRPELFLIEISKQLSFHFRQNYVAADSQNGAALFVLKVGDNPWCTGGGPPKPSYIEKVMKENAQPVPNFCPEPVQLLLLLGAEEKANMDKAASDPRPLINQARNAAFTFRRDMVEIDKRLVTGRVGSKIEILGDHYVRRLSVVIKSHEGNVMTFEWQGMSVVVTQDGFEFELCGTRDNSIGLLLAALIDRYAQDRDQGAETSEQDEYQLAEAA
jgi:hypothetical protein